MSKVAGVILLVDNIEQSVAFYQKLGFSVTEERPQIATVVNLDKFWIELLHKSKVVSAEYKADIDQQKGAGIYLQVNVSDIDAFYEAVVKKGVKPSSKPENFPWNQREFIVVDPDGYKVAFFSVL